MKQIAASETGTGGGSSGVCLHDVLWRRLKLLNVPATGRDIKCFVTSAEFLIVASDEYQ